jgi:molybdopterin converting factor small subunit
MKIRLDIQTLPELQKAVGRKSVDVEFEGGTISDFIGHLVGRYGRRVQDALCDESGEIDPVIKVVLNSEKFIVREQFEATALSEGDSVKFMVFVAGG